MRNRIYVPSKGADSWKEFLAQPDLHWKTGYSARTMAHCWEDANEFPKEIRNAFYSANLQLEMLLAIPEYKVHLDTGNAPSQNDVFVLSRDSKGLAVIMIEGKVSESFDKTVEEWNDSDGKKSRIKFLTEKLEVSASFAEVEGLRYQLFHRAVSAILVSEQFYAKKAIMLVHSFSQTKEWFNDYQNFLRIISPNISPQSNGINKVKVLKSGIELYMGWIQGNEKYLTV